MIYGMTIFGQVRIKELKAEAEIEAERINSIRATLRASNLFRESFGDLHLIGTPFVFENVLINDEDLIFYSRGWKSLTHISVSPETFEVFSNPTRNVEYLSFEHVFNNVTNQHREKLAFMLDILDC